MTKKGKMMLVALALMVLLSSAAVGLSKTYASSQAKATSAPNTAVQAHDKETKDDRDQPGDKETSDDNQADPDGLNGVEVSDQGQ